MRIRRFVKVVAISLKDSARIWQPKRFIGSDSRKIYSLEYRPNDVFCLNIKETLDKNNLSIDGFLLNENEYRLIKPLFYKKVENTDKEYAKSQTFLKNRHQRIIINNLTNNK